MWAWVPVERREAPGAPPRRGKSLQELGVPKDILVPGDLAQTQLHVDGYCRAKAVFSGGRLAQYPLERHVTVVTQRALSAQHGTEFPVYP